MNMRLVELTVDIAKAAMEKSTGGFVQSPEGLLNFLEQTATKLEDILEGTAKKKS